MPNHANFLGWEEQLHELQKTYNLQIESKESALATLKKYAFHSLVQGYLPSLKDPKQPTRFMPGISIETLGVIQMIENRLSSELLQAIISIEKNMKALFQQAISKELGTKESDYLRPDPYLSWKTQRQQTLALFLEKTKKSQQVSSDLHRHRQTGNVPPWVLVNEISFGQFMHWYMMSPLPVKRLVVADFTMPFTEERQRLDCFKEALGFLVSFRNGLAHGTLIGQIRSKASLHYEQIQPFYEESVINLEEFTEGHGKRDFFGLLLVIGIFLKQSERQIFKDQLLNLLAILDTLIPLNQMAMRQILGNAPLNLLERVEKILWWKKSRVIEITQDFWIALKHDAD